MQIESFKSCLSKLEKIMHGYNFQVTFGIEVFTNCKTYEAFKPKLKHAYPNSRPEQVLILEIDQIAFWEEIKYCFKYHEKKTDDHFVDNKKQLQIETEQNNYISYITEFISDNSKIYSYPDDEGIPGYPVWWEFRFIIFAEMGSCIFIYGSACD